MGRFLLAPSVLASVSPLYGLNNFQILIGLLFTGAHLLASVDHGERWLVSYELLVILVVSNSCIFTLTDLVILVRFRLSKVVGDAVNHSLVLGPLLVL